MSASTADDAAPQEGSAAASEAPASPARRRSLAEGSVRGHLFRLILPMTLGIFATMTTGLVDAFWLGRLGTAELAAVSFCFPVTMAMFSIAIGLGAGTASVVARAAGGDDEARVRQLVTHAFLLTFLIMALVCLIGGATITPLFSALGARGEVLEHIRAYMGVWYVGMLFVVGPLMANSVLRALGDARAPSLIMISVAFTNLILDPLLIFGIGPFPRLEVAGAALATLLANLLAFVAAFWLLAIREKVVSFAATSMSVVLSTWREIARIGVPAAGSNMINPVANTVVVSTLAAHGAAAVAGFGVGARVEALAIIPLFALSASIGPITGQNLGAGRPDRVREAFLESYRFALLWALGMAAVLAVAAPFVGPAFTDDPEAQAVSRLYLWMLPITTAGYGVVIAMSAGFNGLGRPWPGLIASSGRALAISAPGALIGGTLFGPVGAFAGLALGNLLGGTAAAAWTLLVAYPRALADPRPKPEA